MRFKTPLVLFLLSAAAGVSIAYDRSAAWAAFSRIVGGLALFIILSRAPERVRVHKWEVPILQALLGSLPSFLAIYFFLTNDWKMATDKLPDLAPVVNFAARLHPSLTAYGLHPNVVGGLIATLLPIQVAVLKQNSWERGLPVTFPWLGLSCCTLLLSGSRGAWFSLSLL